MSHNSGADRDGDYVNREPNSARDDREEVSEKEHSKRNHFTRL